MSLPFFFSFCYAFFFFKFYFLSFYSCARCSWCTKCQWSVPRLRPGILATTSQRWRLSRHWLHAGTAGLLQSSLDPCQQGPCRWAQPQGGWPDRGQLIPVPGDCTQQSWAKWAQPAVTSDCGQRSLEWVMASIYRLWCYVKRVKE